MSAEIRNCEFRFKCHKTWDALEVTPNPTQRFCHECNRTVIYCVTPAELQSAIVKNQCVAVELRSGEGFEPRILVGDPIEPGKSCDHVERTKALESMMDAADKEADMALVMHPGRGELGFCHIVWETKKRILKEKYGMEWKTPAEENPDTCFD